MFNEATHIRIHICELHEAPLELQPIVALSEKSDARQAGNGSNSKSSSVMFLGTEIGAAA